MMDRQSIHACHERSPDPSPNRPQQRGLMKRIGLLGGSFNPAHRGHRRMSLAAMDALGLDEVWWLVSPGNPLKAAEGMAPYPARLASARRQARRSRIRVSDFEAA